MYQKNVAQNAFNCQNQSSQKYYHEMPLFSLQLPETVWVTSPLKTATGSWMNSVPWVAMSPRWLACFLRPSPAPRLYVCTVLKWYNLYIVLLGGPTFAFAVFQWHFDWPFHKSGHLLIRTPIYSGHFLLVPQCVHFGILLYNIFPCPQVILNSMYGLFQMTELSTLKLFEVIEGIAIPKDWDSVDLIKQTSSLMHSSCNTYYAGRWVAVCEKGAGYNWVLYGVPVAAGVPVCIGAGYSWNIQLRVRGG